MPDFILGFATPAEQVPDVVGTPQEKERFDPASGGPLRRTTTVLTRQSRNQEGCTLEPR